MADASIHGIEFVIRGNSNSASDSISQLTSQLNKLKGALSSAKGTTAMTNGIKKVGEEAKKQSSHTSQFLSSVMRIAKYRLIRSALKAIVSAFQEGLKNAYMFSKGIGGDLAEALDTLKTKSTTMKNQMGAAFGGLITAITPIVVGIIKIINTLAAAITRLIAILGGKSYWLRAKDNWTEWGEAASGAGGAAKEALRYLAPFDELNRLPDENSGGGGGGGSTPDFSSMFEQVSIEEGAGFLDTLTEAFQNIANWFDTQNWQELGAKFWETIKGLFTSSDEADGVVAAFFEALGTAFGAVLATVWGFLKGVAKDLFYYLKQEVVDYNGDDKITLIDLVTAAFNIQADITSWVYDNIIAPLWRGIYRGFHDGSQEDATPMDFLNWILDSGILSPITNDTVRAWLKEHILDPIVEFFKEKVTGGLGISIMDLIFGTGEDDNPSSHSSSSFSIEGTATITNIQDNLSEQSRTISTVANFVRRAKLTGVMALGGDGTIFPAVANFVKRLPIAQGAMKLGEAGTIFGAVANFVKRNTSDTFKLGGTNTIFGSVANFLDRKLGTNFSSIFDSQANFTSRSTGGFFSTLFDSLANFTQAQWDSRYDPPKINAIANCTSASYSGGAIAVPGHVYTNQAVKNGGVFKNGAWSNIPQYATGGKPHGSLFLAGEAGAELVGHIGGRTEVLNRSQLAATMYAAVRSAIASTGFRVSGVSAMAASVPSESGNNEEAMYRAMLRALNDSDVGDRPIELDGNTIYQNMVNRNRANTRLTGVNAMA